MKKIPAFKSEDDERNFWAMADSTEYVDWTLAQRLTLSRRTVASRAPRGKPSDEPAQV